jgi:hypothetical protein
MAENPSKWLYHLTRRDINELEDAATFYLGLSRDIGQISKKDFPLPSFSSYIKRLKHKLLNGVGVEVIRGLPVHSYSQEFAATIFCGLGSHLGSARSQNAQGHILGHVRNTGATSQNTNTRIYQTSERQTFHTDSADVVGLLCIRQAKEGGTSLLVSVETIYNQIQLRSPRLVSHLFKPIATDRRGEVPEGAEPFFEIPVLNWYKGYLTAMYQRQYIDSAQQFSGAKKLTKDQIEALDCFDRVSNESGLYFSMELEPGDMQFVHNHSHLHDRTEFVDWPEPDRSRHLMRLWLSINGDRPLPKCFKQRYGSIKIGDRGGVITKNTTLNVPLD